MICKFCKKSIGNYKIKVYKQVWIKGFLEEVSLCTVFVCTDCLKKDNVKFSEL